MAHAGFDPHNPAQDARLATEPRQMLVSPSVAFVTHPRLCLDRGPPPRPPWRREYAPYCLRATCFMEDQTGATVGRVVGYDRYVEIQDTVTNACLITSRGQPGVSCSAPQLTLLREYRKECSGQVFVIEDGSVRRLFAS